MSAGEGNVLSFLDLGNHPRETQAFGALARRHRRLRAAGEHSATVNVAACQNRLDQSVFPIERGRQPVSPILAITARIVSLPIGFWIGGHNLRPWRAASRCKASRSHGLPLLINCTMPS